jgi:uncharacterized protein (DUF433 family)
MTVDDLITIDPGILGGTPVFKGTRVPVRTLFEYLENDYSLEEILECFPSLSREAVRRYWSALSRHCSRLHENSVGRVRSLANVQVYKRSTHARVCKHKAGAVLETAIC